MLDSLKTIPLILKETIFFLQSPVDTFYDQHKTHHEMEGLFTLAEAHDLAEENSLKELPLTNLEHEELITSIVSPGNMFEYTVYKPGSQIRVMANPNPAAAQIIPGPYIGYNR